MRKIGLALFALCAAMTAMLVPSAPAFAADMFAHAANLGHALDLGAAALAIIPGAAALQEQRGRLVTQAREAFDAISDNTDEARTAELEQRHDAIMAEVDAIDQRIARAERQEALDRSIEDEQRNRRPLNNGGEGRGSDIGADDPQAAYRDAFYAMLAAGGDVSELDGEQRSALRAGFVRDPRAEGRAQSTSNTAGGYTVPTELFNRIVESMAATGPMYDPGVTTELVTSGGNPIKVPTVDDTSKSAALHTEAGTVTDDGGEDVTFGQKSLDAYVYDTEWLRISMELLQDSAFNVEAIVGGLLGKRLGRKANSILTTGTGSSQPNGIVTASSLGKTAAATGAITFDEIIDLEHSVDPAYRTSAAFMFHDTTLQAIRKLKDSEGRYIWQMGDVQKGVPASLNGRRYHINQAMDTLAAAKKVMLFGDLSAYFVRKVGAPTVGVVRERFFPDIGLLGLVRLDGELSDTAAVKHLITAAS
jgi:HK97 family phage major capsid protein